jgi:hypothetical protein
MKPDSAATLASLKDFQRDSVEYAFRRLWTDPDRVKRFLVADEVGLGKTMIAKGVISKTVDHLWETDKRIDIVYICSNGQIARQNLSRLNVVGGASVQHADRLTLLPTVVRDLRENKINFLSFTPGTSWNFGTSTGTARERVMLYWMLDRAWGGQMAASVRWAKFFQGYKGWVRFDTEIAEFDQDSLDDELCLSLAERVAEARGPLGGALREELEQCAAEFTYLRSQPTGELQRRRNDLVAVLRHLVASASISHLEPDLVIMDEFQRFKDLLDADHDGARLARELFDYPDARVLLLSATPYKMYTLPDEAEGDDHYQDFVRTARFLAGDQRARSIESDLREMREAVLTGGDTEAAKAARDRVQAQLRRVMSRTERLASTPDRDGMLQEKSLPELKLGTHDVHTYRTFNEVAQALNSRDVFEYWRSTPYPLNLMDRHGYQIRTRFQEAADAQDPRIIQALSGGTGLMDWNDIRNYNEIDFGNAKMRALIHDVLDREAWRLAWLPPAMPYYQLSGAYAQPELASFTKRLIFSAWAVVPKSIAALLSYEAERRTLAESGYQSRRYDDRPITPPLRFIVNNDRPQGMPALALLYPSVALAEVGDPLQIARELAGQGQPSSEQVLAIVEERISELLDQLPAGEGEAVDQQWYWAAPFLLDKNRADQADLEFGRHLFQQDDQHGEAGHAGLDEHLAIARSVGTWELGARPDDLAEVLAQMAIAGPGVCALRALSRVTGGEVAFTNPAVRASSEQIAMALRSLFNKPEIVLLLRSETDEPYWRSVLSHGLAGGLQPMLDEYVHVLLESEGLQQADVPQRAEDISEAMIEALTLRSAANQVEDVRVVAGEISTETQSISSHFAAKFGRLESTEQSAVREEVVRTAFNSPFRPFVLASTSVGQEGLDFHPYCHALVHWNLPSNPVDLEQREGRVHRYKGHAVRKNVAADFREVMASGDNDDPWVDVFAAAETARPASASDLTPFWVYANGGDAAVIERYVAALPLSREQQQYQRLQRTVGAYRMVIGQPRQEELVKYLGEDASWLRIDLSPPAFRKY